MDSATFKPVQREVSKAGHKKRNICNTLTEIQFDDVKIPVCLIIQQFLVRVEKLSCNVG